MTPEEMAVPDEPVEVIDPEGLRNALLGYDSQLEARDATLTAMKRTARAAVFIFDRAPNSIRTLKGVSSHHAELRRYAEDWYEQGEEPYFLVFIATHPTPNFAVPLPEEALAGEAPALEELTERIPDMKTTWFRSEALPPEHSSVLNRRWVALGGMALVDGA